MNSPYPFEIDAQYRRRDIYRIIGIPENTIGGHWHTGYNHLGDDWFLFCNIDAPSRTEPNYPNEFVGDDLRWFGKTYAHLSHADIQAMLSGKGYVYVFTRTDRGAPFIFAGTATAVEVKDTVPVEILWRFNEGAEARLEVLAEEVVIPKTFYEGATKTISVNIYERNPVARRLCIEHHGIRCAVCGINLEDVYGPVAHGFIHVHHLKPLHEVGAVYQVDPVRDLRPVCPNCHTMLHRQEPALSIKELQNQMAAHRERKR